MAGVVFGSVEAQTILKQDRVLRAEVAKEARIKKARLEGDEIGWEVTIESCRTEFVTAYSEEEAWDLAAGLLEFDEDIVRLEKR